MLARETEWVFRAKFSILVDRGLRNVTILVASWRGEKNCKGLGTSCRGRSEISVREENFSRDRVEGSNSRGCSRFSKESRVSRKTLNGNNSKKINRVLGIFGESRLSPEFSGIPTFSRVSKFSEILPHSSRTSGSRTRSVSTYSTKKV